MIEITNLKKKFGAKWVTNGVSLSIPAGSMTCIVGRSGEGKSVLLKQIIGLIKPTSGSISIDGVTITNLSGKKLFEYVFAKCGYVFQYAALLDSLTVLDNVALPLLERGMSKEQATQIVQEKLHQVGLAREVLYKYPAELSGGMQKRVGIARTLVNNPSIILYDEPTTGLDPITSRLVYELMQTMQKTLGVTSIVISHDTAIFNYVDYVGLLHEGAIRFFGSAHTLWQSNNPYIYQFLRGLTQGPLTNLV